MDKRIISTSSEKTEEFARQIGSRLKGSEVIELIADLGGGKTTFVRGLVLGAGSKDHVTSPSFTISNEYQAKDFRIYHFDFFRLDKPGLVKDALAEQLTSRQSVVVIEWGEIVDSVLPDRRLKISFRVVSEDSRELTLNYPQSLEYLVEGLY